MRGKKVLLAVCGSISFYKSFEILSNLKKEGYDVYVALSDGAQKFITPKAYEALCDHPVLYSGSENWQNGITHLEYSKVDLVIIAPASVNTINKLAWGVCDNVFLETLNAAIGTAQFVIAPAANPRMLENPISKNGLEILLDKTNAVFVEPVEKELACKETGKGGLASAKTILEAAKRALFSGDSFYKGKNVIITGGPTIEKIDSVRGLTNFSSGKMSKAIADAFYYLGANVTLVTSNDYDSVPYKIVKFESSIGLKSALDSLKIPFDAYLVMAAAVSDFTPKVRYKQKVKKDDIGEIWNLRLGVNEDILGSFKERSFKKIGFKLETDKDTALTDAKRMLIHKGLDAVCLNILDDVVKLGGDLSRVTFITKHSETLIDTAPKIEVALKIAELIKNI